MSDSFSCLFRRSCRPKSTPDGARTFPSYAFPSELLLAAVLEVDDEVPQGDRSSPSSHICPQACRAINFFFFFSNRPRLFPFLRTRSSSSARIPSQVLLFLSPNTGLFFESDGAAVVSDRSSSRRSFFRPINPVSPLTALRSYRKKHFSIVFLTPSPPSSSHLLTLMA